MSENFKEIDSHKQISEHHEAETSVEVIEKKIETETIEIGETLYTLDENLAQSDLFENLPQEIKEQVGGKMEQVCGSLLLAGGMFANAYYNDIFTPIENIIKALRKEMSVEEATLTLSAAALNLLVFRVGELLYKGTLVPRLQDLYERHKRRLESDTKRWSSEDLFAALDLFH